MFKSFIVYHKHSRIELELEMYKQFDGSHSKLNCTSGVEGLFTCVFWSLCKKHKVFLEQTGSLCAWGPSSVFRCRCLWCPARLLNYQRDVWSTLIYFGPFLTLVVRILIDSVLSSSPQSIEYFAYYD